MSATLQPLAAVAEQLGLREDEWLPYGTDKAKIRLSVLERLADRPRGRYVLITGINPTPLGEGKTTTAIGLAMGLCRAAQRAVVTLRQPSLGPIFGIKGGGTGGGKSQLEPGYDINLNFTGDAYAVAASHNLLAAFLDNHLYHGNSLGLAPASISWPRVMAVSDRALRRVTLEGDGPQGRRDDHFVITEASEVMAILALARDRADLRERLGRILVGLTGHDTPVTADDLQAAGAMDVLLQEALLPNLVQTSEGTPALVHTGPFGNIAHGNCSILADAIALRTADYVVTEAGFGTELGAEKFFDIKCRVSGLVPDVAAVVVTLRALKLHGGGGAAKPGGLLPIGLTGPNPEALELGMANLAQHLDNIRAFGVPTVVAINAFADDSPAELDWVKSHAISLGAADAAVTTAYLDGGAGAVELARAVEGAANKPADFRLLYSEADSIEQKIETIATRMYGAGGVSYHEKAERQIALARQLGFDHLPICMAKTPLSLSHDPNLKGRPTGFTLPIKELRILAGAGFLTAICSGIQLMPGLPKHPAGERFTVDPATGAISGLA